MRTLYLSVGVVSAVFIALQLNLVRVLSTLLSYHFVFSVVSLAMLGLGIGGVIVQRFSNDRVPKKALLFFVWSSLISTLLALFVMSWMAQQGIFFEHYYVYFLVILVPFTFGGCFFAQAYRSFSFYGSQLYAVDLLGAAVGCLLGVALLNWVGAMAGILVLAALLGVVVWYLPRVKGRGSIAALFIALGCILWAGGSQYLISPWLMMSERNPVKEISDALTGPLQGTVTRQQWSAFGLTEQVEYSNTDEHRDLYIDGTAGTPMYAFTGDFKNPGKAVDKLFRLFPGAVPFQVIEPENKGNALIIGPGGGRDVLLAAGFGFEQITGIEVNPDLIEIVQSQPEFNGGLYAGFEHINIQEAEGRHFVQRAAEQYDLIMLSLPVTNTSRSPEGFALTENFLLTEEAIEDYLEHLTPQGQLIVITHDELAVLRLIMTALNAYAAHGYDVQQAFQRFYVLGSFPYPIVVFSKQAFTAEKSVQLLHHSMQRNYSMNASYFPQLIGPGRGNPMLQALAKGDADVEQVQEHIRGMGFNVNSITDDRPFFYHFDLQPPKILMWVFYVALGTTLVVWFWSSAVGLSRPHLASRHRQPAMSTAFAGLGSGFMLLEIILVQKLTFYLGNPVLALALLLAALLVGMALGSKLTSYISITQLRPQAIRAALAVGLVGIFYQWLLPIVLQGTLIWPLNMRLLFSCLLLLPIGIVLGLCFPLLIRLLGVQGQEPSIPWMWAINGCASVLGASAAVLGALYLGLQQIFWIGVLLYLLVATSVYLMKPHYANGISAIPKCKSRSSSAE